MQTNYCKKNNFFCIFVLCYTYHDVGENPRSPVSDKNVGWGVEANPSSIISCQNKIWFTGSKGDWLYVMEKREKKLLMGLYDRNWIFKAFLNISLQIC